MDKKESPLVTFALLAYNQERYIREAVEGALAQNYEPLEIIISDDCSSDGTVDVIREVVSSYRGPHRVIVCVNEKNLGLIGHVNKIASICSGRLIVVAAGDDVSYSSRTAVIAHIFYNSQQEPLLIHSSVEEMSMEGHSMGVRRPPLRSSADLGDISIISSSNSICIGASAAWNKKLFEVYGPIKYPAAYEDIVLGARAAMMNGLVYCDSPLLKYRTGTGITTSNERLRSLKLCVAWRRAWISAMEHVYLQRIEDAEKIGFFAGKTKMMRRLKSFSARRRMYEGGRSLVVEVLSSPILSMGRIVFEFAAIGAILLRRLGLVMGAVRSNQAETEL